MLCTSSNYLINKGNTNTLAFLKLRQHSSSRQEEGSGLMERVRSWRAGQTDTCHREHRLGKGGFPQAVWWGAGLCIRPHHRLPNRILLTK